MAAVVGFRSEIHDFLLLFVGKTTGLYGQTLLLQAVNISVRSCLQDRTGSVLRGCAVASRCEVRKIDSATASTAFSLQVSSHAVWRNRGMA